jgi:hypothetical protein
MAGRPNEHCSAFAGRQMASQQCHRPYIDHGPMFGNDGMEVRRRMIVRIELNLYPSTIATVDMAPPAPSVQQYPAPGCATIAQWDLRGPSLRPQFTAQMPVSGRLRKERTIVCLDPLFSGRRLGAGDSPWRERLARLPAGQGQGPNRNRQ